MNDKYRKLTNNYYRAIDEEDRVDYLKEVIKQEQKINSFYDQIYSDIEEKINEFSPGDPVHSVFFEWMTGNDEEIEWLGSGKQKSKKEIIEEFRETHDIPEVINHQKDDLGELGTIRMFYWGEKLFSVLNQIALDSGDEPDIGLELLKIEVVELEELLLEENFLSLSEKLKEVEVEMENKSKDGSNVIDFQKYKKEKKL